MEHQKIGRYHPIACDISKHMECSYNALKLLTEGQKVVAVLSAVLQFALLGVTAFPLGSLSQTVRSPMAHDQYLTAHRMFFKPRLTYICVRAHC